MAIILKQILYAGLCGALPGCDGPQEHTTIPCHQQDNLVAAKFAGIVMFLDILDVDTPLLSHLTQA